MINSLLRTILQEYSNIRGLGHPMTTEQQLNAFANWLTKTLPECIDVIAKLGSETKATLTGNGTPNNHYILTITLNKNDLVVSGEFQSKNITSTQININDIVKTETSYQLQGTQTFSYDDGTSNQAPYSTEIAIDSGEGIVLDITEDNDGLEIHLDAEVTSKLSRCLLLPISAPNEISFVGIGTNKKQLLIPKSQVEGAKSMHCYYTYIGTDLGLEVKGTASGGGWLYVFKYASTLKGYINNNTPMPIDAGCYELLNESSSPLTTTMNCEITQDGTTMCTVQNADVIKIVIGGYGSSNDELFIITNGEVTI